MNSNTQKKKPHPHDNVINIFTKKNIAQQHNKIIRIAPENDGMTILYGNDANPEKTFSIKILCWALLSNGNIDAIIPWLNKVVQAQKISDPLNGHWKGYYNPETKKISYSIPKYKASELKAAAFYYTTTNRKTLIAQQEIPDIIGTHAIFTDPDTNAISLSHIVSWQLLNNGKMQAMIINPKKIKTTPILPKDDCLYPVEKDTKFHYFFQHEIANKLKHQHSLAGLAKILNQNKTH